MRLVSVRAPALRGYVDHRGKAAQIAVRFDHETMAALNAEANKREVPLAVIVREAVELWRNR